MFNFVSYNLKTFCHCLFVMCVIYTDTFHFMLPLLFEFWEKVLARDNKYSPFLEALINGNRQVE